MLATPVHPASLMPIAVELIRCGEAFDFDLYLRDQRGGKPVLYRGKAFPIQRSDLQALKRRGIRTLFIGSDCLAQYERYLHERVLSDDGASPATRFCALREANRSVFLAAMHERHVGRVVEVAGDLAAKLADVVCAEERTVDNLFKLLSHDYYTYTHVTNVCVYTLALARKLGMSGQTELAMIATGALLHDVGKRYIPLVILNKRGKLTDAEFSVVKQHPLTGFRDLCRRDDLTWPQLMMVYQHHERLDGRGYPVGILAEEMLPWSRICAIADVFDALTSYRPYRAPMPLSEVREFFRHNVGSAFDADMVDCWDRALNWGGVAC